ncbi:MAG: hypothetical protein KatS3mg126_1001 [Lysobacteraceae bacterium]|nr:MAG: hypothetical protein KatS3mg126_1001 [Xanthomonadaceae bacterium]
MNKVGFRHLAPLGALALALGLSAGTASACSTAAWTSVTGAPVAGGPLEGNGVIRYRGLCGLRTAAGGNSYVAVDHGTQESTYRARFYFFASASGTVMESYSDAGATTPVISVAYDSSAGTISATVPGSTGLSVSGIVPNRWYGVQVTRIVGQPRRCSRCAAARRLTRDQRHHQRRACHRHTGNATGAAFVSPGSGPSVSACRGHHRGRVRGQPRRQSHCPAVQGGCQWRQCATMLSDIVGVAA